MHPYPQQPFVFAGGGTPAPPPAPRRRNTAAIVLIVLAVIVALAVVLPVAFLGIRYLTFGSGPHTALPAVCATLTSAQSRELIGAGTPVDGQSVESTGEPANTCRIEFRDAGDLEISVTYRHRDWRSSGVTKTREGFANQSNVIRGSYPPRTGPLRAEAPIEGAGEESLCVGRADDAVNMYYQCTIRDGNARIDISYKPSFLSESDIAEQNRVSESTVADVVTRTTTEVIRPFALDVVAGLT